MRVNTVSSRERVGVGSDGTSPSGWGDEERGEEEQEKEEEEEEEEATGMKAADCYEGGGIELGGGRGREMLFVVALPAPLVLTHTSHHLSLSRNHSAVVSRLRSSLCPRHSRSLTRYIISLIQ